MAFFKSRNSGDLSAAAPIQPESVEAVRRRAKHRLIGSAVLVLAVLAHKAVYSMLVLTISCLMLLVEQYSHLHNNLHNSN